VFEPVRLHASELSDRADRDILTFKQEGRVVIDWLSLLSENDGIRILSETSVRVIEVTNRNRFESAIERLVGSYRWRPLFLSGYGERWLKAADISAERWDNLLKKPLQMRSPDGTPAAELLGIFIHETPPEVIVDIWLKPLKYLTVSEGSPWFVFFHGLSAEAQIQQAPQSIYIDPAEGKSVRQYRFRLPFLPFSGAIGVYRPGADAFLVSESKDWDGRRVQFSMRETANIGAFVR
jgi:hypothetical protein